MACLSITLYQFRNSQIYRYVYLHSTATWNCTVNQYTQLLSLTLMPEICFNLEFHRQMFKSQTEVTALQNVFSFFPVSNPYISAVSFLCASKAMKNCSNHTKVARFTRFTETNCTFLPDSAVRPYPYSGQVSISYHITVSVKVGQVL